MAPGTGGPDARAVDLISSTGKIFWSAIFIDAASHWERQPQYLANLATMLNAFVWKSPSTPDSKNKAD
jgi:hypothetical protein